MAVPGPIPTAGTKLRFKIPPQALGIRIDFQAAIGIKGGGVTLTNGLEWLGGR